VENTQKIEAAFLEFVARDRKEILDTIETGRELTPEVVEGLDKAIVDYKDAHGANYEVVE